MINVSLACLTAYLASIMTLFGSALVVSSLPWNQSKAPSTLVQQSTTVRSEIPVQVSSNISSLGPEGIQMEMENDISPPEVSLHLPMGILTVDIDIPANPGTIGISRFYPHLSDPPIFKADNLSRPLIANSTKPLIYVGPKKHSLFFELMLPNKANFHSPLSCLIFA